MAQIIINADDLGLSKGVNEGILYCYQNGIVNSSSMLTNTCYFEETVDIIKKNKLKNIGLHFNLTEGLPVLKNHKSIVDDFGLLKRDIYKNYSLSLDEVYKELEAQYQKAIKAGLIINHIDSHHHIHMTSNLYKAFITLSKKYNIQLRKYTNKSRSPLKIFHFYKKTLGVNYYTPFFCADFYDENATEENMLKILNKYKGKGIEIMCHPGYIDNENGVYNIQRKRELDILCNNELKVIINNIK